jgi:hypothetical protein
MPQKTDELTLAKIKRAYLAGEGSLESLAERFGVGVRTIKRFASEQDWNALKKARGVVVNQMLPDRAIASGDCDTNALLLAAIQDLAASMPGVPVRSRESAAAAMGKLIETWRRFNPMTMDELVDVAIAIPNFEPREFARLLRERMERSG